MSEEIKQSLKKWCENSGGEFHADTVLPIIRVMPYTPSKFEAVTCKFKSPVELEVKVHEKPISTVGKRERVAMNIYNVLQIYGKDIPRVELKVRNLFLGGSRFESANLKMRRPLGYSELKKKADKVTFIVTEGKDLEVSLYE